jgi:uncharacterized protein (DUF4415 family)
MSSDINFSKGRRGQAVPTKGKTRITMYIDDSILKSFRVESALSGVGYQTLINDALAQHVGLIEKPLTADQVRKIVRKELNHGR